MDIIFVNAAKGRTWRLRLDRRGLAVWFPAAFAMLLVMGLGFAVGHWLRPSSGLLPEEVASRWAGDVREQREQLAKTRSQAEEDAHALARRIAQLQAHVMRLDAAGSRMAQIAKIDSREFNFDKPPAVGGPEAPADGQPAVLGEVLGSLDTLEKQLADRERQMRVLEDLLLASRLQKEVKPAGWPVDVGYITSGYGNRTDPFTGLRAYHPGVDFAANEGSEVLAVAAGIVSEADDEKSGYGNLIEINHGNGYSTRYGHNAKLLVKAGDRVNKGQAIALMGSTGRSTGPHVHFEVLLNGNVVNPEQYIQAAR